MANRPNRYRSRTLFSQLRWFTGLRWIAGGGVVAAALSNMFLVDWFARSAVMLAVGLVILAYNLLLVRTIRRVRRRSVVLGWLAWGQILADLVCLTILVLETGGWQSPLLGFYVFHMVFASLLLPAYVSYGAAGAALVMLLGALAATGAIPPHLEGRMVLGGWVVAITLTVYLSNHIVEAMRAHEAGLIQRNRRIRLMARQLRLHQASLIQQEKLAAMGQMAAGISHEIANPLANMDMVLQLLERKPERMTAERIAELMDQTSRIQETIRRMRNFSHPTASEWEEIRINDAMDDAMAMVKFDHRTRQVEIVRTPSPGECRVRVQPHALQQIIVNALLNALDAVAEVEKPSIRMEAGCTSERCSIYVIDNGPGIAPEDLPRVFEPFYTTKSVGKGTGLGLSISYSLARRQGATLEIGPEAEGGTRLSIHLVRAPDGRQGDGCEDPECMCQPRFSDTGESPAPDSKN